MAGRLVGLFIVIEVVWWSFQKGVPEPEKPKGSWHLELFHQLDTKVACARCNQSVLCGSLKENASDLPLRVDSQSTSVLGHLFLDTTVWLFPKTYLGVPTDFSETYMARVELVHWSSRDVVAIHCKKRWRVLAGLLLVDSAKLYALKADQIVVHPDIHHSAFLESPVFLASNLRNHGCFSPSQQAVWLCFVSSHPETL